MKKKYLIIFAVLLILAAAIFFVCKSGVISVLKYSKNYSAEELTSMMKQHSEQLDDEIRTYFNNELREYTPEELKQLENGEISSDALLAKVIAEKYESLSASADNDKKAVSTQQTDVSQSTEAAGNISQTATAEQITGKYVSRLYSLQGSYIGKLDGLMGSAKAEYNALPEEERTRSKALSIASKYISRGYALEGSCDAQVNSILSSLESELTAINADTSIVSKIRSHYKSEKSIKKAYYMSLLK